jgi:hypothetical protein
MTARHRVANDQRMATRATPLIGSPSAWRFVALVDDAVARFFVSEGIELTRSLGVGVQAVEHAGGASGSTARSSVGASRIHAVDACPSQGGATGVSWSMTRKGNA